jgi:hypothetical protein
MTLSWQKLLRKNPYLIIQIRAWYCPFEQEVVGICTEGYTLTKTTTTKVLFLH